MTVPWKSRRTSSVTTATELSGVVTTSRDTYSHIQEKSHLLVTRAICGSFSVTTWTGTRGCTAERSPTSVIAAIRTSHGQTGCWDTGGYVQLGWAKRKTSTHRTSLPIQLPGAPYSLPTTAWLSDPPLPHRDPTDSSLLLSSTVTWTQPRLNTTNLNFALAGSLTELHHGFLYFFNQLFHPRRRQRGEGLIHDTGQQVLVLWQ